MIESTAPHAPANAPERFDVALVWENFGPTHHDRLLALRKAGINAVGIEFRGTSGVYDWGRFDGKGPLLTLSAKPLGHLALAKRLVGMVKAHGITTVLACHYELPGVALAAVMLRMEGCRVFTMCESKHDDYPRAAWAQALKPLLFRPYHGALVPSRRSFDYVAGFGIAHDRIAQGYSAIDTQGFAALGADGGGAAYADRHFLIVARLVPKKNLAFAIRTFARYVGEGGDRQLHIAGYGPLEDELRALAVGLGVQDRVIFLGNRTREEVARLMHGALALVLPSIEEQFGLVINEALSCGLPVLVTTNAGAVDVLVDDGGNGMIFSPTDEAALLTALHRLSGDEAAWHAMADAAQASSLRGDVRIFVDGVRQLMEG